IHVETSTTTQNPNVDHCDENPVRIIPGLAGIVQSVKLHKQADIHKGGSGVGGSGVGGSGVGGTRMLDEEEILKFLEEEMAKEEWKVGRNGIDEHEHQLRLDQEALIHALKEEARAKQEWYRRIK
ncbi:hypothetical protein Tco_0289505, partial [Tanacetum coccineum]